MSTDTAFPANFILKAGRIPCGRKYIPLEAVSRVFDGTNYGDPNAFQQEINITHVEAPSSTTVPPVVFPPWTTSIEKATWYGRCILTLDKLNFYSKLIEFILYMASKSASI